VRPRSQPPALAAEHDGDIGAALQSKSALVAKAIALDMVALEKGAHFPPVSEYAKRFAVGTGTVQTALAYLQEIGAMELETRGRLGTVVSGRDLGRLWRVATDRPVLCCLPMPYSRIFEGLSTGMREGFRRASLNLAFIHVDGSLERVNAVLRGEADFGILSRLAAELAVEQGSRIALVCSLGRGSFIQRHVIVTREGDAPRVADGITVGIDPSSIDQPYITRLLCGERDVRVREVRYVDFEQLLLAREIDLIVWHSDDTTSLRSPGLARAPLPASLLRRLGGRNTQATAVARADDPAIQSIVSAAVSVELVRRVQAQVIRGLRVAA
jgi:hypothetical protein